MLKISKKFKMKKRGISEVVATVLLILISVIAAFMIAGFLIPWIKEKIESSRTCLDVVGKVSINANSGLTCFKSDVNETGITVKIGNLEKEVEGVVILLSGEGAGKNFEIRNGTKNEKIKMLGKNYNEELEIPGIGEEKTYFFLTDFTVERAEIAPILAAGKKCDVTDETEIQSC